MYGKKKLSPWFVGGSLAGFGLLVFTLVLLVSRTSSDTATTDVRAKAGQTAGIPLAASIVSVNQTTRTVVTDQMKMANSDAQIPGEWVGTAKTGVDLTGILKDDRVILTIDSPTFSIENHTFVFTDVQKL